MNCLAGKRAIGGGADVDGVNASGVEVESNPDVLLNRTVHFSEGWQATAREDDVGYDGLWRITVVAICATVQ